MSVAPGQVLGRGQPESPLAGAEISSSWMQTLRAGVNARIDSRVLPEASVMLFARSALICYQARLLDVTRALADGRVHVLVHVHDTLRMMARDIIISGRAGMTWSTEWASGGPSYDQVCVFNSPARVSQCSRHNVLMPSP